MGGDILLCRNFHIENGNISQNIIQLKGEATYFCVETSALKMVISVSLIQKKGEVISEMMMRSALF